MKLHKLTDHEKLVRRASNWLWQNQSHGACPVVITELRSQSPEHPDAVGFRNGLSILVECKASRADFKSDSDKHFRRFSGHAMGNYRYYLVPLGMVAAEEVPEDWGLLEDTGTMIRVAKAARFNISTDRAYEIEMLCSALRRQIGETHSSVRCRVYQLDAGGTPEAAIYAETMDKIRKNTVAINAAEEDSFLAQRRSTPPLDEGLFG